MVTPHRGRNGQSGFGGELRLDVASYLTKIEKDIFGILLQAAKSAKSGTVVRVAGGWVRDKLLGLENEDIDIAVDNCTGVAFAKLVNVYLGSLGQEGKIAVIEANPEQSKHLETARMKILGVWVDLVNLRTEIYRPDSRIPEASLGTAQEDCLRRDFTINALFYNVNTGSIEDMTRRGVDDLGKGIIRTPLSPMVTFQDDPLRVLRAIRFASRFGFSLHEDLRAAAQDRKIQAALESKVSRERVGAELSGMMTGKMAQPGLAFFLLQELGLAQSVYAPPDNLTPSPPESGFKWAHGAAVALAAADVLAFRAALEAGEESKNSEDTGNDQDNAAVAVAAGAGSQKEVLKMENIADGSIHRTSGNMIRDGKEVEASDSDDVFNEQGKSKEAGSMVVSAAPAALAPTSADVEGGTKEGAVPGGVAPTRVATAIGTAKSEAEGKGDRNSLSASAPKGKQESLEPGKRGVKVIGEPQVLVRELFLSAVLLPLAGVQQKSKKGKFVSAAQAVVQASLKMKAKEAKNVGEILEALPTFRQLADAYVSNSGVSALQACEAGRKMGAQPCAGLSRLAVGLAIRQVKELWPTCVDLCCAIEMCELQETRQKNAKHVAGAGDGRGNGSTGDVGGSTLPAGKRAKVENNGEGEVEGDGEEEQKEAVFTKYRGFGEAVISMGLGRAWSIPPLVGGNDVMSILGVVKGPEVGKLMAKQVRWQLEHPDASREECFNYLETAVGGEDSSNN